MSPLINSPREYSMKITKHYIVAVNQAGETVGIVTDLGNNHKLIPINEFDPEYQSPYFWGTWKTHQLQISAGMKHYREKYFDNELPEFIKKESQQKISPDPFSFQIKQIDFEI